MWLTLYCRSSASSKHSDVEEEHLSTESTTTETTTIDNGQKPDYSSILRNKSKKITNNSSSDLNNSRSLVIHETTTSPRSMSFPSEANYRVSFATDVTSNERRSTMSGAAMRDSMYNEVPVVKVTLLRSLEN